jgi:hypothetical protein
MSPFRRPSTRFIPRVEALEDRLAPAGVLVTRLSGNVLSITGQSNANPVLQNQKFALLGAGVGHVSIKPQDGETIQGRNSFNGVRHIVMRLNGGDDTVTIVDLRINKPGNTVDFQGGAGNNSLLFDGEKIDIANLNVTSGTVATRATDTFTFGPTHPIKMHFINVTINCPNAACNLTLGGMGVDKATKVTTSTTRDDVVLMDDSNFKTFTLATGGGNDTIAMGHLDQGDGEELIFAGKTIITMGDGNDTFTAGITVHGFEGDDEEDTPDFTRFKDAVLLDGGAGTDTIEVHHPRSTEFSLDDNPELEDWEDILYNP